MDQPILRTGIPLRCPACRTRVLHVVEAVLSCDCGWRTEAANGVFSLRENLSPGESVQRELYDVVQLGGLQRSDPFNHFVSPAGLRLTRMLRRLNLPPGGAYLEVACAAGPLLDAMASNHDARGFGVDISAASAAQQMLRRGSRSSFDVVVASAEELPFPDATFDAIAAFDIVEHLEHPEAFYRDAARVLKPGGRMLLRAPVLDFRLTLDWWQKLLTPGRWDKRMRGIGHFYENFRTKAQHKGFAQENGLEVIHVSGFDIMWDNFIEYMLLPALLRLKPESAAATNCSETSSPDGIALHVPSSLPHRVMRAWARVAAVALWPERLLGRLGFGASMWLLAEKPKSRS